MTTNKTSGEAANVREQKRAPWVLVWAVRLGLGTGVAASVFANAMHARPDVIARGIAAWAPLAFFLVVELLSRMPARRSPAMFVRLAGAGIVGGVAAWVSYWHMVAVASKYGEQYPHLLPLSVDGLIVVTSMCLFELKRRPANERTATTNEPIAAPTPVHQYARPIGPRPAPKVPAAEPHRPKRGQLIGKPGRVANPNRDQAVSRVQAGEDTAAVAADLKVTRRAVQNWVQKAQSEPPAVPQVNGHEFTPGAAMEEAN